MQAYVELTAVGAEFLQRAQQALTSIDQALASVREQVAIRMRFSWLLSDPWAQLTSRLPRRCRRRFH